MPGNEKAKGRVVVLIVLLLLAAAALHGYLPGGARTHREPATGSPAAMYAVIAMLSVSVAIVAVAILIRMLYGRARAPGVDHHPEMIGRGERPQWRWLLIGLGILVVWIVVVLLLLRLGAHHLNQPGINQHAPATASNTATPNSGTAPQPHPSPPSGDLVAYLGASTIALVLLVAIGTIVTSRRQRRIGDSHTGPVDPPEPTTEAHGPETIARAAELGLAEIGDLSREPREAIIACYATMERELAHIPGAVPQDCDTPTEVLARAIEHHALRSDSAAKLVDLFAEARFSPHVMNEGHREVAVAVLAQIVAEVRSAA